MKILIAYILLGVLTYRAQDVLGDRTSLKIYKNIQSDIFCFRRLNATHQIGCASHSSGNVGVLFILEDEEGVMNLTSDEPQMPYVAAIPISLFNMKNMKKLKQTEYIRGVLIFKTDIMETPKSFSPDQSCPNRNYGFYTEDLNKEYASCKKKEWNKLPGNEALGMMFEDWAMPIFIITNQSHVMSIRNCFTNFNNDTSLDKPLCSVQMTSVMLAAKDSATCMRRNKLIANLNEVKTCDPLSDKNVVNTLYPKNKSEEIPEKSIIVIGARLDAFSMFDKLAPGAHSTVTGLVTLLTVAKHMMDLKKEIEKKGKRIPQKNILFIIFNGEAFDYIGSSRIVFDMQRGEFPVPLADDINDQPALINITHISHFIELSQLAPSDTPPKIWLHTDPISAKKPDVAREVEKLAKILKSEAQRKGFQVSETPEDMPLPPASFQSFLKEDSSIPGIVLADHEEEFINRYYNSIFDSDATVDIPQLIKVLSNTAAAVSGTLYQLLTNEVLAEPVSSSEDLVSGLLECYLKNASCPLFREIADPSMTERLRVEPYPLYVSVDSGSHAKANAITLYTRYLFAYLTGEEEPTRVRENCTGESQDQIYHYDWMAGSEVNKSGVCVKSTVMYTLAQSPAYVLNDWNSKEYSTWTESVWMETSARIFVQPGKTQEALTLVAGIIIFALSIASVYFVNERSSIIFNTKPLVGC